MFARRAAAALATAVVLGAPTAKGLCAPSPSTAATAAAGDSVRLGEDAAAPTVAASLTVEASGGARHATAAAWRAVAGGVEREVEGDGWRGTLRLAADGEAVAVTATLRYDRDVTVEREALRLLLDGPARALGRDLAFADVTGPARVDTGTPILVTTPALLVAARDGLLAARYAPAPGGHVAVDLLLDDAAAHPFAAYRRCHSRYHPEDERSLVKHARRLRHAGEAVIAHATIALRAAPSTGSATADSGPLVVERWPAGRRAAVVFTDHADRTDARALRAVLYGTSDTKDARYGKGGFLGHRVRLTKTFFARPGRGSLDDDADARALAEALVAAGDEVGPHSITPRKDAPAVVAAGLADFARLGAVTWIDHQPTTNCEAISNGGARDGDAFRSVDLLARAGYRWLWAASDEAFAAGARLGNILRPERPDAAEPPYYVLPFAVAGGVLRVMRAMWFYDEPGRLARAVSDEALARLEAERGLFVGHTYLSASAESTRTPKLRARLLVHPQRSLSLLPHPPVGPQPGGALTLDPRFDALLARIERHVDDGRLASLTWRDAGDRLVALEGVAVRYRSDGAAVLENRGPAAIAGLTVAAPREGLAFTVEGAHLDGSRSEPGRSTAWFDLPAGATVVVRATDGKSGAARPLVTTRAPVGRVVSR